MSTKGQKAKRKLAGTSPPKRNAKGGKNSEADCLICEEPIVEQSENCTGDEALFCEGSCQGWIHRKCAGVTRPAFDKLGESDTPYFCSHCTLVNQNKEINNLANIIKDLNTSIMSLTETISSLQSNITKQSNQVQQPSTSVSPPTASPRLVSSNSFTSSDRKFNVVVYGITECPANTNKQSRTQADLATFTTTLKEKKVMIESDSIKDLHRLGKYNSGNAKPRPLLVKFLRSADAIQVLSNQALFKYPINIKPDLSPEELATESALLKERRALINQNVERKRIKMRNNVLYLDNKIYGKFNGTEFVRTASANIQSCEMDTTSVNPGAQSS